MEEILMLKNVSVFYGEHPVLKDVNMGIRPGCMVFCGKSRRQS